MPLKSTKEKKIRYKKFFYSNRFLRPWRPQSLHGLSKVVLSRSRHIADPPSTPLSATPPGSSLPVPCAPRRESAGDERRTREVQTMDSVRGCVGGAALSPGIVAARLLCRCFVTDRKVACLVCANPVHDR